MKAIIRHTLPMKLAMLLVVMFGGLIISGNNLRAQSTIGLSPGGFYGLPDTVANGDHYPVGTFVEIQSLIDSLNNDSVQLVGYIDTIPGPSTTIPFASPYASITLNPGDSAFFILPITFTAGATGQGFRIGNNVIVVWPICTSNPNFSTGDSITANVIVLDGISTGPEPEPGNVRCYPVPANGPLYVTSSDSNLVVKEIIVRNAAGEIVAVSDNPTLAIPTEYWAPGVYMLEVTFENGKRSFYKIMR
jgi:hypothetical protein